MEKGRAGKEDGDAGSGSRSHGEGGILRETSRKCACEPRQYLRARAGQQKGS